VVVGFGSLGEGAAAMVVRLVRAGVGALLLLIAVPLALAGGGLWMAMEHRAADDTFTARLERLRSGGRAGAKYPGAKYPGAKYPDTAPAGQGFWLAESVTVDGVAQLTWSPSALRGGTWRSWS
jgi:hypothetical protein